MKHFRASNKGFDILKRKMKGAGMGKSQDQAMERAEKFISCLEDIRAKAIAMLIMETGIALGPATALKKRDYSGRYIIRPEGWKKSIKRKACISGGTIKDVLDRAASGKKADDFLFSTPGGKQIGRRRIEQILKENSGKTGIRMTSRDLRKIFLMQCIEDAYKESQAKRKGRGKNTGTRNKAGNCSGRSPRKDMGARLRQRTNLLSIKPKEQGNQGIIQNIDFTSGVHYLAAMIILETGCTANELLSLKKENIMGMAVAIRRKNRNHVAKISEELSLRLKEHCRKAEKGSFIIHGERKGSISKRRLEQILKNYSDSYSTDISPRALRRDAAAMMHSRGIPNKRIAEKLGIKKVDIFTHGLIDLEGRR